MQIPKQEVSKHNTKSDCWVIIHGKAYDLTDFLPEHPGGSRIILKYAGRDATAAFEPIHPPDIIEKLLPPSVLKGDVEGYNDASTNNQKSSKLSHSKKKPAKPQFQLDSRLPPLSMMLNLGDFEAAAKLVMKPEAWAYYSSAADDEMSLRENRFVFQRVWLKPRVMVDVRKVDTSCKILGYLSSLPIYITATALGKLGHPEGECVLTRAAGNQNIIQMIPTLASCSLDEICNARQSPGQIQFFQLYVNSNREITKFLVQKAEKLGCRAIFITVDAPTLAKREKDMRMKYVNQPPQVQQQSESSNQFNRSQGAARAIGSFIDPSLNWSDLRWFRQITKLPLILKGVQTAEDAVLAYEHGVEGIVLSNHGGRQLDFSRSALEILPEVRRALLERGANLDRFEIYIDGGIRRGTDIIKALAMGAKAVGLGRPMLYAMSSYGQAGVESAINILREELEMSMRLLGVNSIDQINHTHINYSQLSIHPAQSPKQHLDSGLYDPLAPAVEAPSRSTENRSKL